MKNDYPFKHTFKVSTNIKRNRDEVAMRDEADNPLSSQN